MSHDTWVKVDYPGKGCGVALVETPCMSFDTDDSTYIPKLLVFGKVGSLPCGETSNQGFIHYCETCCKKFGWLW